MSYRRKRHRGNGAVAVNLSDSKPEKPVRPPIEHEPEVEIFEPRGNADLVAIHQVLMIMGDECSRVPVNPEKVMAHIVNCAQHPGENIVLMAVVEGCLAGVLILVEEPYWYSDDTLLVDRPFYVLPKYRGADVGRELIRAARFIADQSDMMVLIAETNPNRPRGIKSDMQRVASLMGYTPAGAVLAFGKTTYSRAN
jgi:GNAT superfamily N-acetyltransferase